MQIEIPKLSLVALVGATSSGKTTFAKKHFKSTEILSSDYFRGLVSDDENNQEVNSEAFDLLYKTAETRLTLGKLTVIDATNIRKNDRKKIVELAKSQNIHAAAIVLDVPMKTLLERNAERQDRKVPENVVHRHYSELHEGMKKLRKEGFRFVHILFPDDIENAEIVRTKLWNDKRDEHGPFDIIGDVHGCYDELTELLEKLGYTKNTEGIYSHTEGRKAVFLGDICDRGNQNVNVLKTVMNMVKSGNAIAVPGNHDAKLVKYLSGKRVQITNGLENTVAELENETSDFRNEVRDFLDGLISHYVLDDGKLVVAHAGIKQEYIGRASAAVRDFCLYGETNGEKDNFGLPVRLDWAADYRGKAVVVYGHTPVENIKPVNNTYCIDTGCVFGGKLTALKYPEMERVSIEAKQIYCKPAKPFKEINDFSALPSANEFLGKLHIETSLIPSINIQEENSAAAFEAMARFAADPHWLIYLPPTMSPCETSSNNYYLEYPTEAFEYYRKNGIRNVICEKKHMGSRAIIVLCRTPETAKERFKVDDGSRGIIYTRTGRRFFDDSEKEIFLLNRLDEILTASNFWSDFNTDWVCLDTELMPWNEKAQELIKTQYAATGHAAINSLNTAVSMLDKAYARNCTNSSENSVDLEGVLLKFASMQQSAKGYVKAYGEYCRKVGSAADIRIAPFHLLACEGNVFSDRPHKWHMETIEKYITEKDDIFIKTPYICIDTEDENGVTKGVNWWKAVTGKGGEGMVVKPENFIAHKGKKLIQPAVKCRGQEYLRIIYGLDYLRSSNLDRLKKRPLLRKRTLALKEFSLGIESLDRFVRNEPLYKVHECVFGVLALESEPTDPRL